MFCVQQFFIALARSPERVCYGLKHVQRANDQLAITTLLVTDALFRSPDVQTRKTYVQLVESVRENGGVVRIFSSMHVTGERLNNFTGVAAILRFPLPEEEREDEHKGDDEAEEEDGHGDDHALWFPPQKVEEVRDQLAEDIEEMGL